MKSKKKAKFLQNFTNYSLGKILLEQFEYLVYKKFVYYVIKERSITNDKSSYKRIWKNRP